MDVVFVVVGWGVEVLVIVVVVFCRCYYQPFPRSPCPSIFVWMSLVWGLDVVVVVVGWGVDVSPVVVVEAFDMFGRFSATAHKVNRRR